MKMFAERDAGLNILGTNENCAESFGSSHHAIDAEFSFSDAPPKDRFPNAKSNDMGASQCRG